MTNKVKRKQRYISVASAALMGMLLWAGTALAETGDGQPAAVPSENTSESALLSATYKCPDCQTKQKKAQHAKTWLMQLKKTLKQKQQQLNQNQQDQTKLDGDIKDLKQQIKDQEGTGASSTDTTTGITTHAYDNGQGWVEVTTQEPGQQPQFQRRYKRDSTRKIEQEIAKKQTEKQGLEKEAETLRGEIQRLKADVLKAEADFQNQLAVLAACKDECDLEVADKSAIGTDASGEAKVVIASGMALDTAGRELVVRESVPVDLSSDTQTPSPDTQSVADQPDGSLAEGQGDTNLQHDQGVSNSGKDNDFSSDGGTEALPDTQSVADPQDGSLDGGQGGSGVDKASDIPANDGSTSPATDANPTENQIADTSQQGGVSATPATNTDASSSSATTDDTTQVKTEDTASSSNQGVVDTSPNMAESAKRFSDMLDSPSAGSSASDDGLQDGYVPGGDKADVTEGNGPQISDDDNFAPRLGASYELSSGVRIDLGARYLWNDKAHRRQMLLGDRWSAELDRERVVRARESDDPNHISVYPAIAMDYKFGSSLSVGLLGQQTDDNRQWQPEIPARGSSSQEQVNLSDMDALRMYIGWTVWGAVWADAYADEVGEVVLEETGNPVIAAIAMATFIDFYNSPFIGFGTGMVHRYRTRNVMMGLNEVWQFLMENRLGTGMTATQAGIAMAEATFAMGGNVDFATAAASAAVTNWPGVTQADLTAISLYLAYMRFGFVLFHRAPDMAFNPGKAIRNMSLIDPFVMGPILIYAELIRRFLDDAGPNDPLYKKKGGGGKAIKKGFGFLLGAVGVSSGSDEESARDQYGLHAVGYTPRGQPGSAWDVYDGSQKNVVVAVIDSGLDAGHIDAPQYQWTNVEEIPGNGIDDDANGYVDDIHGWNFVSETNDLTDDFGHGTFVAGIIAAKRNNGEGIAGINPGARIMTLKVLNHEGFTKSLPVYRAIRYAVDNGARILNLSLGGRGLSPLEQLGINYAYAMGCVVIVAAGNSGADIANYGPPGSRRTLSVAALDMDGKPRGSSNRGLKVALAAPGHSIYSLTAKKGARDGKFMPIMVGKYFRASGTSFSAPFVAATASLIWAQNPVLSNGQVEDMILQAAQDVHDQGWDPKTGHGRLDAYGALTQDPEALLVPRVTEVFVNRHKRKIASVDLYGVIRGNLDHYSVFVGRGKKPKKWQMVQGPSSNSVEHDLISRIDGKYFAKGKLWTVRLDALDKQQQLKRIEIQVNKKKKEE